MIPKIIHYCWFGGNPKPAAFMDYLNTWKKYNPDFEIKEWNESNIDINSHPFMKAAYEHKAWAFVSDVARLMVVEKYGGIYLDTDVELKKSLEPLRSHAAYFPQQQNQRLINTGLGFGAEAHHPAVQALLALYDQTPFDPGQKLALSCPNLNTQALAQLGWKDSGDQIWTNDSFTVYPPAYFDPISTGQSENLLGDQTYSIHHYAATWTPAKQRWKRKLVNMIGPETAHTIKKLLKKS